MIVVTTNNAHYPAAKAALENGFPVVCDKPLTTSSKDAEDLARIARAKDLLFCVTYAYSGYPMVAHIRDMIAAGEIGEIRFVNAEYPQEWLATKLEATGQKQAVSRTDPKLAGISNCVGDIGSHIEFMAALHDRPARSNRSAPASTISARAGPSRTTPRSWSTTRAARRASTGARRSPSATTTVCASASTAPRARSSGSRRRRTTARLSLLDRPTETLSRGRDPLSPRAQALSRIPSGHPEGYFEAFANIYSTYIAALAKKLRGEPLSPADLDFPGLDEGVRGVRFIEKCVESSKQGAVWVRVD